MNYCIKHNKLCELANAFGYCQVTTCIKQFQNQTISLGEIDSIISPQTIGNIEFNIDLLKRLMNEINQPRYIVFGSQELSDDILQELKDLQCEYKRVSDNYTKDGRQFLLLIGTNYFEPEPFNVDHIKSKELIYSSEWNGNDTPSPLVNIIEYKVNNSK